MVEKLFGQTMSQASGCQWRLGGYILYDGMIEGIGRTDRGIR